MNENERASELCLAAKEGDREAASQLLLIYHGRIFAYFRRLCSSAADAEDLTQRVFCKVWRSLGSYQGRSSFYTWVHGISYHVFTDWCRREKREESRSDFWWNDLPEDAPSPFDTAADAELATVLYQLVDTLDQEPRNLIHLHYYQGLSLKETAEVLGIASSTVKYRLRAAMETIRAGAKHVKAEQGFGGIHHEK